MVGPCFVNMGAKSIKLSDIKVAGYENSDYYMWEEMAAPMVIVQRRASSGQPYAQYSWSDEFDGETWTGGFWYKDMGEEEDPVLNPGDALWAQTPDLEDCEAFTFVVAGEVVKGSIAFTLNAGGKISVCNPTPVNIMLGDVEIHGYEDSDYYMWEEMAAPMVIVQALMPSGQPYAQYSWSDEFDGETWTGGFWYKDLGEDDADSFEMKSGAGLWAQSPDLEDCEAFIMTFPAAL